VSKRAFVVVVAVVAVVRYDDVDVFPENHD